MTELDELAVPGEPTNDAAPLDNLATPQPQAPDNRPAKPIAPSPAEKSLVSDRTVPTLQRESETSFEDTLTGAAFRQWNIVGSSVSSPYLLERLMPTNRTPLETEDLISRLDKDHLWGLEDHFIDLQTVGQYEAMKRQVEMERADRQILADASLIDRSFVGLVAAAVDLPSLIPFGPVVRGVQIARSIKGVATAAGVGLKAGATAGAVTAGAELGLHATQELRTAEESALNIGGSALLFSVFGSVATGLVGRRGDLEVGNRAAGVANRWWGDPNFNNRLLEEADSTWQAFNEQIQQQILVKGRPTKKLSAQGQQAFDALAAAEERLALYNDLSMAKAGPLEWARTVGPRIAGTFSARWLDPVDFVFKRSQTVAGKKAMEQMIEVPVLLNKNLRGGATAIGATTEVDRFVGGWATFRDQMLGGSLVQEAQRKLAKGSSFYAQARKAGFQGNFNAFDAAVDRAVRNGYIDPAGNSAVTAAARSLKELIIDPVAAEAKAAGVALPDHPLGALGYAPRKYNVQNVMGPDGQGVAFKNEVAKHQYAKLLDDAKAELKAGEILSPQKVSGLYRTARKFANEAFKSIIGGRIDEEGAFQNAFLTGGSPFAARVVPVPDSVLASNGWIDESVTALMDVYLRQTVPTLLLARRFKTPAGLPDPNLEASAIPEIRKEYEQLATVARSPAEREALNAEGERVVAMVRNIRDAILHSDRFTPQTRWHNRLNNAVQVTKLYQVTRLMGNIGLSSLPDLANIVARQGPARFAKNVGQSFLNVARVEGIRGHAAAAEAKRLGAAVEWATNQSMVANADLMSPLNGVSSPVSRFVHRSARVFSVTNFSTWWNDTMKVATYRTSVDRILEAAERGFDSVPQSERVFLSHLGLDRGSVNRIGAAWRSQTEPLHDGFLRWATVNDWSDNEAARLMAAALNKDVASTIIRPRTGDKALGFSGPLAQLVFQFQGFMMSHALRTLTLSEQRLIANGAFGRDALRIYTGVGAAISLGWFAEYLYALARDAGLDNDEQKHVRNLIDNPGQHLSRAIDRSAFTGLFGQANQFWERFGGVGQTRMISDFFEDESRQVQARGRWMGRDPLQTLMGPTMSEISDLLKFGVKTSKVLTDGEDFVARDARTLREASPFQNHILLRFIFDEAEQALAEDLLPGN